MRRPLFWTTLFAAALLTSAVPALAQDEGPSSEEFSELLERCQDEIGWQPGDPLPEMTRVGGGEWKCHDTSIQPRFDFGSLVVIALLWSVAPFAIALWVASSRGESGGLAVGLVLVLGWVGLAIVLYGMRKAKKTIAEEIKSLDE